MNARGPCEASKEMTRTDMDAFIDTMRVGVAPYLNLPEFLPLCRGGAGSTAIGFLLRSEPF